MPINRKERDRNNKRAGKEIGSEQADGGDAGQADAGVSPVRQRSDVTGGSDLGPDPEVSYTTPGGEVYSGREVY